VCEIDPVSDLYSLCPYGFRLSESWHLVIPPGRRVCTTHWHAREYEQLKEWWVGITSPQMYGPGYRLRVWLVQSRFISSPKFKIVSGAHPASYSLHTGVPFPGLKLPGREVERTPPSHSEPSWLLWASFTFIPIEGWHFDDIGLYAMNCPARFYNDAEIILTLSLLMSYIYGVSCKARNFNVYINGLRFGNAESRLFLFSVQCFNT
jgi:hypothetical protein